MLKTGDLTKITGELTRLFGGQAEAQANTFAGTIDRLTVAADDTAQLAIEGNDVVPIRLVGSTAPRRIVW